MLFGTTFRKMFSFEKHNDSSKEPDYYNGIINMEKLDIPSENIVSVTTAKEIKESAKQLLDMIEHSK